MTSRRDDEDEEDVKMPVVRAHTARRRRLPLSFALPVSSVGGAAHQAARVVPRYEYHSIPSILTRATRQLARTNRDKIWTEMAMLHVQCARDVPYRDLVHK